jgi:hypothetical protein
MRLERSSSYVQETRRQLCWYGVSEVPRWFIEHYMNAKEADVDDWTVQSFLMLIFNALLFPSDSDKMVGLDYLMCMDLGAVPGIN